MKKIIKYLKFGLISVVLIFTLSIGSVQAATYNLGEFVEINDSDYGSYRISIENAHEVDWQNDNAGTKIITVQGIVENIDFDCYGQNLACYKIAETGIQVQDEDGIDLQFVQLAGPTDGAYEVAATVTPSATKRVSLPYYAPLSCQIVTIVIGNEYSIEVPLNDSSESEDLEGFDDASVTDDLTSQLEDLENRLESLESENADLKTQLDSSSDESANELSNDEENSKPDEDELEMMIQQTKESLDLAMSIFGEEIDESGNINVTEEFMENSIATYLMGYYGTISNSTVETYGNLIACMDWIPNDEMDETDFENLLNLLNQYYGTHYGVMSYDNVSDECYVWMDYDNTCTVVAFYDNNNADVRWYWDPNYFATLDSTADDLSTDSAINSDEERESEENVEDTIMYAPDTVISGMIVEASMNVISVQAEDNNIYRCTTDNAEVEVKDGITLGINVEVTLKSEKSNEQGLFDALNVVEITDDLEVETETEGITDGNIDSPIEITTEYGNYYIAVVDAHVMDWETFAKEGMKYVSVQCEVENIDYYNEDSSYAQDLRCSDVAKTGLQLLDEEGFDMEFADVSGGSFSDGIYDVGAKIPRSTKKRVSLPFYVPEDCETVTVVINKEFSKEFSLDESLGATPLSETVQGTGSELETETETEGGTETEKEGTNKKSEEVIESIVEDVENEPKGTEKDTENLKEEEMQSTELVATSNTLEGTVTEVDEDTGDGEAIVLKTDDGKEYMIFTDEAELDLDSSGLEKGIHVSIDLQDTTDTDGFFIANKIKELDGQEKESETHESELSTKSPVATSTDLTGYVYDANGSTLTLSGDDGNEYSIYYADASIEAQDNNLLDGTYCAIMIADVNPAADGNLTALNVEQLDDPSETSANIEDEEKPETESLNEEQVKSSEEEDLDIETYPDLDEEISDAIVKKCYEKIKDSLLAPDSMIIYDCYGRYSQSDELDFSEYGKDLNYKQYDMYTVYFYFGAMNKMGGITDEQYLFICDLSGNILDYCTGSERDEMMDSDDYGYHTSDLIGQWLNVDVATMFFGFGDSWTDYKDYIQSEEFDSLDYEEVLRNIPEDYGVIESIEEETESA